MRPDREIKGLKLNMSSGQGHVTHEPQLGAVFSSRLGAQVAASELQRSGLGVEHLGVAVHGSDVYVLEEDVGAELARGIEAGVAVGAPLGAIAGMAVLTGITGATAGLGLGGILAVGAITGALAGSFWGGYLGLRRREPRIENEWDWERVILAPGQVLVVVDQHGDPEAVREILQRHGGRLVDRPTHVS
jgi:hypothetical protein